jgi:Ca2+/H+ antiporter, TMEM165/GDT1 family
LEPIFEAGSWWSYFLVFLAAATPFLEVLVVIPAAVLAGLSPIPAAAVALTGNLSTVVLVAMTGDKLGSWWRRRSAEEKPPSRRSQRARRLAQRWGVPGLALLGPLTTGAHVATVAALATGTETRRVLGWMTLSLVAWSALAAAATAAGLGLFT